MSRCAGSSWLDRILLSLWLSTALMLLTAASDSGSSQLFPITTSLGIGDPGNGGPPATVTANNSTEVAPLSNADEEDSGNKSMRCDDARLRCAYRTGCGHTLQHYLTRCASVLHGEVTHCPEYCQYALIGLMSTDEGKKLMTCECAPEDQMCKLSKKRVEICRASVMEKMNHTRVSCRVATWICNADSLCLTALRYYHEYCKRMFHGKKCTKRCRNSINILRRQEKAAKLNTCFCDGEEEYDCIAIHRNMDELCFKRPYQHHNYQEQQLGPGGNGGNSTESKNSYEEPNRTKNTVPASRASVHAYAGSQAWRILLLGLVLLLHSVARGE